MGFTTISTGGISNYYNTHRLRSDGDVEVATRFLSTPSGATRLHLSLSMEFPIMSDMVSTYAYWLKYHYYPTQSVTNAVITVVGDGIAQYQEASLQQDDNYGNDKRLDGKNSDAETDRNTDPFYDPKRGVVYFFKGMGSGVLWAWWFDMAEVWSEELTQSVLSYGRSSFDAGGFQFQQSQEAIDQFAISATENGVLPATAQSVRTAINILLEQFMVCPVFFSLWDIPVTSLMRGCPTDHVPFQIKQKLGPLLVANAKVWTLVNIVTYNIPLQYRLLFTGAASIVSESINAKITSKQITSTPETTTKAILPSGIDPQSLSKSIPTMGVETNSNKAKDFVSPAAATATMFPLVRASVLNGNNITLIEF